MKKILSLLLFGLLAYTVSAQVARTKTLSGGAMDADYAYYEFPVVSTTDYITGYVKYIRFDLYCKRK